MKRLARFRMKPEICDIKCSKQAQDVSNNQYQKVRQFFQLYEQQQIRHLQQNYAQSRNNQIEQKVDKAVKKFQIKRFQKKMNKRIRKNHSKIEQHILQRMSQQILADVKLLEKKYNSQNLTNLQNHGYIDKIQDQAKILKCRRKKARRIINITQNLLQLTQYISEDILSELICLEYCLEILKQVVLKFSIIFRKQGACKRKRKRAIMNLKDASKQTQSRQQKLNIYDWCGTQKYRLVSILSQIEIHPYYRRLQQLHMSRSNHIKYLQVQLKQEEIHIMEARVQQIGLGQYQPYMQQQVEESSQISELNVGNHENGCQQSMLNNSSSELISKDSHVYRHRTQSSAKKMIYRY